MATKNFPSRLLRHVGARLLAAGLLCLPAVAWASNFCAKNSSTVEMGTQSLSGGADANIIANLIGVTGNADARRVFDGSELGSNSANCRLVRSWARPARPAVPGVTYIGADGKSYSVFETGIDGIGYAIGIGDFASQEYTPLLASGDTETFVFNGDPMSIPKSIGYRLQIHFVAIGRLKTGTYTLSSERLADFFAETLTGTEESGAYIQVNANFEIIALTCQVIFGADQKMTLPPMPLSTMLSIPIGSTSSLSTTTDLGVSCPRSVSVYASLSDANDLGSAADYLSIMTGDGMAQGVGIVLYEVSRWSGGPPRRITFWPASMGPDPNELYLGISDADKDNVYLGLGLEAKYLRLTEKLTPGVVRGVAMVTFYYR